jgi:hypothetical protein
MKRNNFLHSITVKASATDFQGNACADASWTRDLSGVPHDRANKLYNDIKRLLDAELIHVAELDKEERIKELKKELNELESKLKEEE